MTDNEDLAPERLDLLESLAAHRGFLLRTAAGLSDEQARHRSTVSELTIGGLIKHVAAVEASWAEFMLTGVHGGVPDDVDWSKLDPSDPSSIDPDMVRAYQDGFRLLPGETLAATIEHYQRVAEATDDLVGRLDLDRSFPLPPMPWFEPGATTVRRTVIHIIAETAQHAGHADIIREAIDGAKTMG
jgi:uncharacterized damage-inducible protein DinB